MGVMNQCDFELIQKRYWCIVFESIDHFDIFGVMFLQFGNNWFN